MVILAAVGADRRQPELVTIGFDLASAYDDELQVLHVIPGDGDADHLERLRAIEGLDSSPTADADGAEKAAAALVRLALDDRPERVTPVGRVGDPGEEIVALADSLDARYLVVGGRKRTPAGKALFGSVTQQVILDAACPVVTRITSPIG